MSQQAFKQFKSLKRFERLKRLQRFEQRSLARSRPLIAVTVNNCVFRAKSTPIQSKVSSQSVERQVLFLASSRILCGTNPKNPYAGRVACSRDPFLPSREKVLHKARLRPATFSCSRGIYSKRQYQLRQPFRRFPAAILRHRWRRLAGFLLPAEPRRRPSKLRLDTCS